MFDFLKKRGKKAVVPTLCCGLLMLATTTFAASQLPWFPPEHIRDWPDIFIGETKADIYENLNRGPQYETGRSPAYLLDQHRKMEAALAQLQPGVPGNVDAFILSIALDSDPVFGREAREAGAVLARRYNATDHIVVLAGSEGSAASELPNGSPSTMAMTLARFGELMQAEDVLILYTTGHGAKIGLAYHDGDEGYGMISPSRLSKMLDDVGIENRMLLLSACYSGIFIPALKDDHSIVLTAASASQPSFGCLSDNDWTFFGDALINHAIRKAQPFDAAAQEARAMIRKWESGVRVDPSRPQLHIGDATSVWLGPLETQMPQSETQPVGRPATDAFLSVHDNAGE